MTFPSPSTSPNSALAIAHFVLGGLWLPMAATIGYVATVMIVVTVTPETAANLPEGEPAALTLWEAKPAIARLLIFLLAGPPALLLVASGICIMKSVARWFSLIVAGLMCLFFPIGTAFGVWTLLTLRRSQASK
jgi:hypothetical protein